MPISFDERSFDCFLSHHSRDKPWVIRLKNELQKRGLQVWLDQDEILPGDLFVDALERGIPESRSVVLVVSPAAMESGWVKEEYSQAMRLAQSKNEPLRLIPAILQETELPGFLANRQRVDFRDEADFQRSLELLIEGIQGIRSAPEQVGSHSSNAEVLRLARNRVKQLLIHGADQADINAAQDDVLTARRAIREGNRLRPGNVLIDRYELLECVGSGGFATVWKCFDDQTMTIVAAKILHPSHREERSKIDRFFRGARAMKKLSHENIVRVLDERLSDEGFHFYIMEFVDGDDFHEAILSKRILKEAVLDIILVAADALHHAHTTLPDLVHRDIKPSNILLTANGQARVTDFDLVRTADTTGGTRTGSLGTFIYTAPESLQKAGEVDARADVFSLGMTAVFGLYGKELPVTAFRHTAEFIDSLDCSEGIKFALKRAVEWEPPQRFASMQDFVNGIRQALENQTTASRQASPKRKAGKKPKATPSAAKISSRGKPPKKLEGEVVTNTIDMQLKLIPVGEFMMGSPDSDQNARDHEKPQHLVRITQPFYLGVYVVTQEQYEKVMGVRPWKGTQYAQEGPDNPATYVSHDDARAFCHKLSEQEGVEYCLPTEAQWEYACRAGETTNYSFGDDASVLGEHAWYVQNAWNLGERYAHPVGQKEPNPWGLHDMHGNVWEWCEDWYDMYEASAVDDPSGPASGSSRVLRGGSFIYGAVYCRSAFRNVRPPGYLNLNIGFRVSRTYN